MLWRTQLFAFVLALSLCACHGTVKHVVVVMLENRSFDHMFGFKSGVNGLSGNEVQMFFFDLRHFSPTQFNLVNTSASPAPSMRVYVSKGAPYINPCDPDHDLDPTTQKIFGVHAGPNATETMSGFVEVEAGLGHASLDYCAVMRSFAPHELPVANFLASEFALFDRYFASLPGPTWPNRLFTISGTSVGLTKTGPWFRSETAKLFPQRTIFDQMDEAGKSWKYYYPSTPWELIVRSVLHNHDKLHTFETFLNDCKDGNLPHFSWINPRSGVDGETGLGSNDEHPDHDMALGEAFMKEIYDAVRASPNWNETLLLFTYDEHGGFYDHVPPPVRGVPPPDDMPAFPYPFKFDRLGIRVPMIAVSPLIPRGLVVSAPPASVRPQPTSEYEHTSIMATARRLLRVEHVGALTRRDAWAAPFDHILSLRHPRPTPLHAPAPPPPARHFLEEAELPVNDLQLDILHMHASVSGLDASGVKRQGDLHKELRRHLAESVRLTKLLDHVYGIMLLPREDAAIVDRYWRCDRNATRIHTRTLNVSGTPFCMAHDGDSVSLALCRSGADEQRFLLHTDATIRPTTMPSRCVTVLDVAPIRDDQMPRSKMALRECKDSVAQHFGYYGHASGNYDDGDIVWGDYTMFISVVKNGDG